MNILILILSISAAAIAFFIVGFLARNVFAGRKLMASEEKAKKIIEDAAKEAERNKKEIELDGKDLLIQIKADFEKELSFWFNSISNGLSGYF